MTSSNHQICGPPTLKSSDLVLYNNLTFSESALPIDILNAGPEDAGDKGGENVVKLINTNWRNIPLFLLAICPLLA